MNISFTILFFISFLYFAYISTIFNTKAKKLFKLAKRKDQLMEALFYNKKELLYYINGNEDNEIAEIAVMRKSVKKLQRMTLISFLITMGFLMACLYL